MPRSFCCPAVPPHPHLLRGLAWGTITACLALGGSLAGTLVLAQTPPPTSGEVDLNAMPTSVNGRITRPTLQPGSQGESVIELQAVLKLLGYYSGPISGVYQDNTQAAVQQFQADAGLNSDGIVGPATWSSLFPAPPTEANPPGTSPVATTEPGIVSPTSPEPVQPAPDAASTPTTEPSTAPSSVPNRPILRLGDRGDAVSQLQERLKSLGFYAGSIDGIFGPQTENAVKQAQAANDLTVDGIVGPATWNAIQ